MIRRLVSAVSCRVFMKYRQRPPGRHRDRYGTDPVGTGCHADSHVHVGGSHDGNGSDRLHHVADHVDHGQVDDGPADGTTVTQAVRSLNTSSAGRGEVGMERRAEAKQEA